MLKQIVEAQSPDSMAEAIALAMAEASLFISEANDVRISVLELSAIRKGGYKAVLEVTLIPLGRAETPERKSDQIEPARRAEQAYQQRRTKDAAALKTRIIEQFRRRKSNAVQMTAAMDRPQLTEVELASQLDSEYSPQVPASALSLPDPSLINSEHARVDDKIHHTPIDEIVEREFSHATHPDAREIIVNRRALPDGPVIASDKPHEEPG